MTRSRLFKITLNLAILCAWGTAFFFLLKREGLIPPSEVPQSLSRLIPAEIDIESWRSIYIDNRWIGYIHTIYGPGEAGFVARSRSFLRFSMFNQAQELVIESRQCLDEKHHLQSFETAISGIATASIIGRREGGKLLTTVNYGAVIFQKSFDLGEDFFLDQGILQVYRGKNLSPGETYGFRLLNPLTLQTEKAILRVTGMEGKLLIMETQLAGLVSKSWIDERGMVVREEAPNGWVILSESRESVEMNLEGSRFAVVDILEQVSVPVEKKISRPRSIRSLTLRVSGHDPAGLPSQDLRQTVLDGSQGIVRVASENIDAIAGVPLPVQSEQMEPFLKPSLWIDSDDSSIKTMSRHIIGDERNAWSAARRIGDWVYRNIEKTMTPDIPIATEVLKHRRGDCNEHTSLFVALARAAGIPATMSAGLVYQEGAFYYHVWPRVFVGTWVHMDPTFGQTVADAARLELISGDFSAQARIVMAMGKIGIEIIDYDY